MLGGRGHWRFRKRGGGGRLSHACKGRKGGREGGYGWVNSEGAFSLMGLFGEKG